MPAPQLPVAKTGHDQTHLQRQIDATDRQIDKLVYELYGLTEEEIAVVEGRQMTLLLLLLTTAHVLDNLSRKLNTL